MNPAIAFVALDFETADPGRDSACAVGLVRVENQLIVRRECRLLRPPRREFRFTYLHGISWSSVANQPTFAEVWPELSRLVEGAAFLAAHNAGFDRSVLRTCCEAAGLPPPLIPFACTVSLARQTWSLPSSSLPRVCAHLGIPLKHHDPISDAEACARIVLEAWRMREEGLVVRP
jgi:DNA polymerase-3 subunit epsilon